MIRTSARTKTTEDIMSMHGLLRYLPNETGWAPAACGRATDLYVIYDGGTGTTCEVQQSTPPATRNISSPCDPRVFGFKCGSLRGSLRLVAYRASLAVPYIPPDWGYWLTQLQLNDINVIGGDLQVIVDHTLGFPVPPFTPAASFFQNLQTIMGSLVVTQQPVNYSPPALQAVPALATVAVVKKTLNVSGTAFPNFASTLSGLACSPLQGVSITANPNLTTLNGLDKMERTPGQTGVFAATSNPKLIEISGLSRYAACPNNSSAVVSSIEVIPCTRRIITFRHICIFIVGRACP